MITATTDEYTLAEGPRWDAARRRLLWVDIVGGAVLEGNLHDDGAIEVVERHDFECMVGAVAFATDGTLLVAAQEQLVTVGPDGGRTEGPRVLPSGQNRRTNDGAVDPEGRFVVGTMPIDGESNSEVLVRLEHDGTVTVLDDDLGLSNGLAWSTDGTRMYTVDSTSHTVYVRERDDDRRVHLTVTEGYPDGIAMDAEDHLWVAVWGAGALNRYSPDGELVERLEVPAPHTSAIAFAGDDLRTLVVTTATQHLSDEQLAAYPDSGRLFTIRTDVAGLAPTAWEKTF